MNLCEVDDSVLVKLPCYKSVPSLVPLRISALSKLSFNCFTFVFHTEDGKSFRDFI